MAQQPHSLEGFLENGGLNKLSDSVSLLRRKDVSIHLNLLNLFYLYVHISKKYRDRAAPRRCGH